jgi:hypothetical protein
MAGSRPTRLTRLTAVGALGGLAMGCYTLRPITGTAPPAGTEVAFDITDAGRAALGPTMGPEIARIQGRIVSQDAGDYLVAVSEVSMLRGGTQVWRGEQVRVQPGHIGTTYARRFSAVRTVALGAAVAGGIAILVTQTLTSSGNEDPPLPPDTLATSRGRRP